MKKYYSYISLCLFGLLISSAVFAQTGNIHFADPMVGGGNFDEMLTRVLSWIWPISLILAVLMIIIGGYYMIGSGGDPLKFSTGRKIVVYSLAGAAIVTAARGIISLIEMVLPQGIEAGMVMYNIIVYAFGFLIVVSVLMLIVAGFFLVTSGGNPEQATKAKRWLIYALIGLAVGVLSRGLVAVVISVIWP
jgi:hypothetical protein